MKTTRIALAAAASFVALALAFGQDAADRLRQKLLETADAYRGVPYKYGSESPSAFDCSGFVRWVYREATGIELPRSARGYMDIGTPIPASEAKPGDIFVFNTVGAYASHVALFAGGGMLIHAVSEGPRTGVVVTPASDRYWAARLIAVRSVLGPAGGGPAPSSAPVKPGPAGSAAAKPIEVGAVVDLGIVIPAKKESFADPVPTAAGTSLAFTLTNGTGAADSFIVVFFKMDAATFRLSEISSQKVKLEAGGSFSLPAYTFADPGKYRIVVKGDWGTHLVERTFVVEASR